MDQDGSLGFRHPGCCLPETEARCSHWELDVISLLSTVTTLMLSMMKEEGEEEGQGEKVLISTSKNSEDASLSGQGWHGAETHQDCFTLESISFGQ